VTNDDGIESPALLPLLRALGALEGAEVVALVPDRERSWVGKAITRFDEIEVRTERRDGLEILTCSAFPADCANLGIHSVFEAPPDLVVSGINIGLNSGSAFVSSSGTVGAAAEAAIAGVPALAFSMGPLRMDATWGERARSQEGLGAWHEAAAISAAIVSRVRHRALPDHVDLLNVNIPEGAGRDAPVVVTGVMPTRYHGLFSADARPGRFAHRFQGWFPVIGDALSGDCEALERGAISITPLQVHRGVEIAAELRKRREAPLVGDDPDAEAAESE